jgi:ankyrin repeat protein
VANYLLSHGADVNFKTQKGTTILHLLAYAGKLDTIIDILKRTLADPLIEDDDHKTVLDLVFRISPSYAAEVQSVIETRVVVPVVVIK